MILPKMCSLGGKQHVLTYSKQNEYVVPTNMLLLDEYSINYILWNNVNLRKKHSKQRLSSEINDQCARIVCGRWRDRTMVKTKDHQICIGCTKLRHFYTDIPDQFLFYLRFSYCFFFGIMSVCLYVRACVYKPNNNSCDIH